MTNQDKLAINLICQAFNIPLKNILYIARSEEIDLCQEDQKVRSRLYSAAGDLVFKVIPDDN